MLYFIVVPFAIVQLYCAAFAAYFAWHRSLHTPFTVLSLIMNFVFAAYTLRYYVYGFASLLREQRVSTGDLGDHNSIVSVMLPIYNEAEVIDRLLLACTSFDYDDYEVIVVDDSTDPVCLAKLEKWRNHPRVVVIHRHSREGAKAGALNLGMEYVDPRSTHILLFDADFLPPRDIIPRMLSGFTDERIAAVQGYQQHTLNAEQNWITKASRILYSSSYMVDLAGRAQVGSLLQVTGSVVMLRTDILKRINWMPGIAEDWDITVRLYLNGYRVSYDENLRAPAECIPTIKHFAKQQMRWAMGASAVVRRHFFHILVSQHLNIREKVEFLFLSFFYLQAFVIALGHVVLFLTLIMGPPPNLQLLLSGFTYLLINFQVLGLIGLYRENMLRQAPWILYATALSYIMIPLLAYASLKGLMLNKEATPFIKTPKTGKMTCHEAYQSSIEVTA